MDTRSDLTPAQQKILEAAIEVFAAKGYNGATTSEIAQKAGVGEATIFKHFNTKKELFLRLVIPALVAFAKPLAIGRLAKLVAENKNTSEKELLLKLFHDRLGLLRKHEKLLKLILYEAQFHPEIREILINELAMKASQVMVEYFNAKKAEGKFRDLDAGVAMRSLVGMFAAFLVWRSLMPSELQMESEEAELEQMVEIFLNGVMRSGGDKHGDNR